MFILSPHPDLYSGDDATEDLYTCDESLDIHMLLQQQSQGFLVRRDSSLVGNLPRHSTPMFSLSPPRVHLSTDDDKSSFDTSVRPKTGNFGILKKDICTGSSSETHNVPAASVSSYIRSPSISVGSTIQESNVRSVSDISHKMGGTCTDSSTWGSVKGSGSGRIQTPSLAHSPTSSARTSRSVKGSGSARFQTPSIAHSRASSSRTLGRVKGSGAGHTRTPPSTRSRTPNSWTPVSFGPSTPGEPPPSSIVAVVEGRGQARGEVGIASIDLKCPQLSLAQFTDTHTYSRTLTKLTIFNPLEVIVVNTEVPSNFSNKSGGTGLMRIIQEGVSGAPVTSLHRRYFNDTQGLAIIKYLASKECAYIERHVAKKYYCLAAVAALMKYVEHIQRVTYAPHSLHVSLSSSENTMCLDYSSCRKLELVRSLNGGWENSLFGALRHTRTAGGTRLLRATLLQPYADETVISSRLDALQYLIENPDLFYTLQSILGRFPDIEWLLSMCVQIPKEDTERRCELRLNYAIALKNTLELLSPINLVLEEATNPLMESVKEAVRSEALNELLELLREILHEDARIVKGNAAMKLQRCYAVKSHINGLLDVARKVYSEIIDDISVLVEELGKKHNLPMRVGHNAARGFHIAIPVKKNSKTPHLPPALIQVQKGSGSITCTTEALYQLDQRSRDTVREILAMSNVIIIEMLVEARGRIGSLHALGEAIANLDLVVCLAHAASVGAWVRPEFSDTLAIRGGRHPILDALSAIPPVANTTFLNRESCVMVITGPNMSGKSTYLRQIALIQILAQIGSFVPAEYVSVRRIHQLFTHLGLEDAPENNSSTFKVQMDDIARMLGEADQDSLVLLDELGSGTSIEEGGGLAWAVMEALIHAQVPTVLATHTLFLTKLADMYPCVSNFHLESMDKGDGRLQFTHVVRPGITKATHYGIALAYVTSFPRSVVNRAHELALNMTPAAQVTTDEDFETVRYHAVYHLAHQLAALAEATNIPRELSLEGVGNGHDSVNVGTTGSYKLKHIMSAEDFFCTEADATTSRTSDGEEIDENGNPTDEIKAKLQTLLMNFMKKIENIPKST
ncbi:MutS protein msh4 [Halocaridina rubra]|uniref:MutS protein msh4 n=1 Tax=Halocaridina rubra TaxID=373956 RepID=A0AAN8X272_HALRR